MKKVTVLILAVIAIILSSCNQATTDVNALFKNTESKEKIFTAITGDHQLMTDFMSAMMNNEHAMMMMKGDNDEFVSVRQSIQSAIPRLPKRSYNELIDRGIAS